MLTGTGFRSMLTPADERAAGLEPVLKTHRRTTSAIAHTTRGKRIQYTGGCAAYVRWTTRIAPGSSPAEGAAPEPEGAHETHSLHAGCRRIIRTGGMRFTDTTG